MFRGTEFPQYEYHADQYNHELIRGVDIGQRPYNLTSEILLRLPSDGILLDIGCGSAVKILPLAKNVGNIIAVDKNPSIVSKAQQNVASSGFENIYVTIADGNQLPFPDESVDMITYMLCPHNVHEALRLLKPNGYIIADRVGEQDKSEIKQYFTNEENKPRGYRSTLPSGEIGRIHKEEFGAAGFRKVISRDMFWQTRYTKEGLWQLLKSTPTIEQFNPETDKDIFEYACSELIEFGKITLTQHRVLVTAKK